MPYGRSKQPGQCWMSGWRKSSSWTPSESPRCRRRQCKSPHYRNRERCKTEQQDGCCPWRQWKEGCAQHPMVWGECPPKWWRGRRQVCRRNERKEPRSPLQYPRGQCHAQRSQPEQASCLLHLLSIHLGHFCVWQHVNLFSTTSCIS